MEKLQREFYDRDTVEVARSLLGRHLVRIWNGIPLVCRITETEAYVGRIDKACHAYHYRRTKRTETLFAPPGTAYIYLIYGMYCCLNFVTEAEGEPCAVLIRGAEPVDGTEWLARNRFGCPAGTLTAQQKKNFLNGPGKLCRALNLTRAQNGFDLTGGELFVTHGDAEVREIQVGKRIGIDYAGEAADFPWRFWLGSGSGQMGGGSL